MAASARVFLNRSTNTATLEVKNQGIDRFAEIIHGPGSVPMQHIFIFLIVGGEKDNGHVLGFLASLDDLRQFETAEVRHADVEDDHGKLLP